MFDGKSLTLLPEVNLGIAIDLSHNELVAPIVRAAADSTPVGPAKAMRRRIEKAKAGKLAPEDLFGGTCSLGDNGAFGTTFTATIVNAPRVAILSIDAIQLKPAVGLYAGRRFPGASRHEDDRSELRSPRLRRRLLRRFSISPQTNHRRSQLERRTGEKLVTRTASHGL
jgi:hypothetical protein